MPPDLALIIGSNYPCLELIYMVLQVFEPLKFDCICIHKTNWGLGSVAELLVTMPKTIFLQLDNELWASEYQEGSTDKCNQAFAVLHTCIQVSRNELGRG